MILMDSEKILVVGDAKGLTPIDIETTKQVELNQNQGAVS